MSTVTPLAQVILFCTDVVRLRDFYVGAFGLAVVEESDGWCRLDAGGCVLALHAIPPEVAGPIADPPIARQDSYFKICFHVDAVDAARATLVARGTPMRDVHRWSGIAFCDGIDPEGNVFQVTTRAAVSR